MIKLYDYPDCPFCQKVRVTLAEKDLTYETIHVDLRKGEQKRPEFLKLNPYGKVPVLVDDGEVIYDSTIINEYLEDEYPHPTLLPTDDSVARARVRLLEDYCDNSFIPAAGEILLQLVKPEAERDPQRLRAAQEQVLRTLERLDTYLAHSDGEYLVKSFSLADIAFTPRVVILPKLGIELDGRFQRVREWIGRLRARPSVKTLGVW